MELLTCPELAELKKRQLLAKSKAQAARGVKMATPLRFRVILKPKPLYIYRLIIYIYVYVYYIILYIYMYVYIYIIYIYVYIYIYIIFLDDVHGFSQL